MYRLAVISLLFLGLLCYRIEGSKTTNTIFNGTTDANVMTYDVGQDRPNWVRSWLANWLVKRSSPFTRVSDKSREAATNLSTIVARPSRNLPMNALMSSFVYSLSMVPILLAITSVFSPIPHGFYGRRKRALVNESHIYRHLPLMNRDETRRFLSLFETTLLNRKIFNEDCKKYYSCQVFHSALRSGSFPTLADFEYALLNVFGIVAERYDFKLDLIPTVKSYYEIATNAFNGMSCSRFYPCNSSVGKAISKRRQSETPSPKLSPAEMPGKKVVTPSSRTNQSIGNFGR